MSSQPHPYPADKVTWVKSPRRSAEGDNKPVAEIVARVLAEVKENGDAAVRRYAQEFDKSDLTATQRFALYTLGRKNTDLFDIPSASSRHHQDFVADIDFTLHNAHQGNHT